MKTTLVVFALFLYGGANSQKLIDQDNPLLKAQIITQDLVVQGSECVGIDCASSESFGFDTGRYKENNLRLHFDDTSASASFPSNDWRFSFNDSANGGANYFRVEDATAGTSPMTISAGSGNNAIFVSASGGNVGLGTATPVVELQVTDGDSPTLRLEQNGSAGFTPQTWDIAGNETNFFVRDVTNSSNLIFRLKSGAPGNSIFVDTDGSVGLGTENPGANKLYVENGDNDFVLTEAGDLGLGTATPAYSLQMIKPNDKVIIAAETVNSAVQLRMKTDRNGKRRIIALNNSDATQSQISLEDAGIVGFFGINNTVFSKITAGSTSLTASSSKHLKKNIQKLEVPQILDRIAAVPVTTYNWKDDIVSKKVSERKVVGLLAQDFYTVLETGKDTEINGQDVQMALWMGVQKLHEENTAIKEALQEKEDRIDALEQKLESLISKIENIDVIDTDIQDSNKSSVAQNIPNPFNENTRINFNIPNDSKSASIQIVNMKGQLLKTIPVSNGKGIVNLKASELPEGAYAYSLIVDGSIIDTKQMIRTNN